MGFRPKKSNGMEDRENECVRVCLSVCECTCGGGVSRGDMEKEWR